MNQEKVDNAITLLKLMQPHTEPYYVCYSGGKDSDVVRILCDMAGVDYELHNNHTTVDAPETVRYIRKVMSQYGEKKHVIDDNGKHMDVYGDKGFIEYPEKSMWQLIVEKRMPPTRIVRYCCAALKETGGRGRKKVTGVRWAESTNRKLNQGKITLSSKPKTVEKKATEYGINFRSTIRGGVVLNDDNAETRQFVEDCYRTVSTMINPIVDWTDEEVWEFLHEHGCESNPLYKKGFTRIGCIGFPMGNGKGQKKQFALYPKIRKCYVNSFQRMIDKRIADGLPCDWGTGEDVMTWWVGDDPNQITMNFDELGNWAGW